MTQEAMAGAGLGLSAVGIVSQQRAARNQENELQTRLVQERTAAAEGAIQRSQQMEEVLAAQAAQAGASGALPESPQFGQLARGSFNKYLEDSRNADLNLEYQEDAINSQIAATRSAARTGLLTTSASLLFQLGSFGRYEAGYGANTIPTYNPNTTTSKL